MPLAHLHAAAGCAERRGAARQHEPARGASTHPRPLQIRPRRVEAAPWCSPATAHTAPCPSLRCPCSCERPVHGVPLGDQAAARAQGGQVSTAQEGGVQGTSAASAPRLDSGTWWPAPTPPSPLPPPHARPRHAVPLAARGFLVALLPVALFHTIGHVSACVSFSQVRRARGCRPSPGRRTDAAGRQPCAPRTAWDVCSTCCLQLPQTAENTRHTPAPQPRANTLQVAVSFAHVVKAAEPVFSVLLSWPLLGLVYPWCGALGSAPAGVQWQLRRVLAAGARSRVRCMRSIQSVLLHPAPLNRARSLPCQVRVGQPAAHRGGLQPECDEGGFLLVGRLQQRDDLKRGHGAAEHLLQEEPQRLQGGWGHQGVGARQAAA